MGDPPAVLTPQREALNQPQDEEEDRGGEPDLCVRRDGTNKGRREAHPGQRNQEGVFPSDEVADPAKDERPKRPDEKTDRKECDGRQKRGDGIGFCEELRRQHPGQASEDVEVVPFNDGTNRGCHEDQAEVPWRHSLHCHGFPPSVDWDWLPWSLVKGSLVEGVYALVSPGIQRAASGPLAAGGKPSAIGLGLPSRTSTDLLRRFRGVLLGLTA